MNKAGAAIAHLTPEEKRDLAKRLLRQRGAAVPVVVESSAEVMARQPEGELPAAYYSFDHHPLHLNLKERWPVAGPAYFHVHDSIARDTTTIAGREYTNFANYNYLGLSGHPRVADAVTEAVQRYGTSVSGSRMVGGERPLHHSLEKALTEILDTDDSLAFVSGHSTNVTSIGYLFGPKDLILHDALAHNSVIMGAILSGARRIAFRHNDWQSVDDLLARHRRDFERVLVVVEGVYSMDGDYPDLPQFVEIRNRHKVFLMVDEAHSLGVLGNRGFGIREHFGLRGTDVDIWMGTLSKALASCGGYIAGRESLIFSLRFGAPGFVFSVGLPPANAAAALTSLEIMKEEPERVHQLRDKAGYFMKLAKLSGLPTGSSAGVCVVPLIVGDTERCLKLTEALFRRGINVPPIIYPAVDERSSRLRFFINCTHTNRQIEEAIGIISEEWRLLHDN